MNQWGHSIDATASGTLKGVPLKVEVLVVSRDTRIADLHVG